MTLFTFIGLGVRYVRGERPGMKSGLVGPAAAALIPTIAAITIEKAVRLVDVSFWQGEINFEVMKEAGISGAIIRAGQRTWVDSRFKVNWDKARLAAVPRGSYWFYDSREDPEKQAELWWSLIQYDVGELVHCADFEESYSGVFGKKEHFKLFLQKFKSLSNLPARRIVVYTGYYWWNSRIGNDPFFKQFRLWLAWYGEMSQVRVPAPWTEDELLFWQYMSSGPGPIYGVSSQEIDLNYFCCSISEFYDYFEIVVLPPTPPDENGGSIVDYYKISSNTDRSRSIRVGPSVRNGKIAQNADLYAGTTGKAGAGPEDVYIYTEDVPDAGIEGGYLARKGDTWRRVVENNGTPVDGWIAKIHLGSTLLNEELIKEGFSTLPEMPYTITLGDDVTYEKQTIQGLLKPKQ